MKPLIGILANLKTIKESHLIGQEEQQLNNSYINAIKITNGIPIIIPVTTDEDDLKRQIGLVDGILLSGGIDINPILYNEDPLEGLGEVNDKLDEFNLSAAKIALDLQKPILGVCRGLQVLNVLLGGNLYQDISHIKGEIINHSQNAKPHTKTHSVNIIEDSKLNNILGDKIYTNSYHHQSIKELGEGLIAVAYSIDGIIEAIEKVDEKFVLATQWHPELMVNSCDNMKKLFEVFVNECKDN